MAWFKCPRGQKKILPAEFVIHATKILSNVSTVREFDFTFQVADQTGKKVADGWILMQQGTESFSFSKIEIKEAGTYSYTVTEDQGYENIVYDASVYQVIVAVGLNTAKTKLEIKQTTYKKDGSVVDGIVFENAGI